LAAFGAHPLEFAMFKLDPRRIAAFGNELDLELGIQRRVGLPLAVQVPAHDEAFGRIPDDDPPDIRLRAVLRELVPAAAETRLHHGRLHRFSGDAVVLFRPPQSETRGEDLKGALLTRADLDGLAHGRDGDRGAHLDFSFCSASFSMWA